ncbi:MAG: hypothetical protein J1F12_00745 [Muribaculaceae bacterium]|nr:hypothetical protein [Muribaculaceae bacterium]
MDSKLRDLLDKIYELEGLVHLAIRREDASEDFLRLIAKKGKEVSDLCLDLDKQDHIDDFSQKPSENPDGGPLAFLLDEYSIDEETQNVVPSLDIENYEIISEEENNKLSEIPEISLQEPEYKKGKLVFSINDRFRFRKELFDNSDADFNNTLALVASMDDYEEAEDYFINEEGFDKGNPVVNDFLEVIKRYFR